MRQAGIAGALTCVLLLSGAALAQTVMELSPDEESAIYTTITRETVGAAPHAQSDWRATVGVEIPTTVELYEVPSSIELAPLRQYRYTIINDEVVLVDPDTRHVVKIIHR